MSRPDPFEILAARRDPQLDQPLAPGEDPVAEQILQQALQSADRHDGQLSATARARRVIAGVFAVSIVGTGAIAVARWVSQPDDTARLSCYSDVAIDPEAQYALPVDTDLTPIDQCAALWADGRLGTGEPPPLSACVSDASITIVVPGGPGTCSSIGLPDLNPDAPTDNVAALVVSGLSDAFDVTPCLDTIGAATDVTRTVLDDAGATDWTVEVQGDVTLERPCLYPSTIPEEQRVLLVPTPPAP
jgi:hypothetical protein